MRGSTDWHRYGDTRAGSIPACAGEPLPSAPVSITMRVYPRVCGGAQRAVGDATGFMGLSPRVRGSPPPRASQVSALGSIPACAGEPAAKRFTLKILRVYPRVCGGAVLNTIVTGCVGGLSPRVRGSLCDMLTNSDYPGSIPACAGEPPIISL